MTVAVTLKSETCRTLLEAWLAARGDRLLPRRADLDPVMLKSIMPNISIFEIREPGVVMVRLAGTHYREIFGFEPTGRNLIDLTPEQFRRVRAYRLRLAANWPCAGRGEINVRFGSQTFDTFEFLTLPLDADSTRMLISATASVSGRRWQNAPSRDLIEASSEDSQYVDIGAGLPPAWDPPDDFLPP